MLHAVVVRGGSLRLSALCPAAAVDELVRRVRADLDVLAQPRLPGPLHGAVRASMQRSLVALDGMLLAPLAVSGRVVRGRMDAVFGSATDGWLVIDWKTGARPTGAAAQATAVQLAAYRLAWARLNGIADADLGSVRAAFHYVRSNETVEPAALLDADGLQVLVSGPIG